MRKTIQVPELKRRRHNGGKKDFYGIHKGHKRNQFRIQKEKGEIMNKTKDRKMVSVPAVIHQELTLHLQQVETKTGMKLTVSSFVSQAIREKIAQQKGN